MTWIRGAGVVVGVVLGMLHAPGIWRSATHLTAMTAVLGSWRVCGWSASRWQPRRSLAVSFRQPPAGPSDSSPAWESVDGQLGTGASERRAASMNIRVFGDPRLFEIGSFPVTETMLASLGVSVVLVVWWPPGFVSPSSTDRTR